MLNHLKITGIHVLDQDEALDFYVNKLGLEVRSDADLGFMRWLTVGVPGDPHREIMLEKPGPPMLDDTTTDQVRSLVSKGAAAGWLIFSTDDAHRAHQELNEKGVELPEEPTKQSYGVDFGFRDPFGNLIRIGQDLPAS
jgi:catechol 2,3-dioxygenase-like lactoylglutathione lyase family enzyme